MDISDEHIFSSLFFVYEVHKNVCLLMLRFINSCFLDPQGATVLIRFPTHRPDYRKQMVKRSCIEHNYTYLFSEDLKSKKYQITFHMENLWLPLTCNWSVNHAFIAHFSLKTRNLPTKLQNLHPFKNLTWVFFSL